MKNELLEQLYKQYYKEIYLYLYSLSKNTQVSDDLTQDTFLKALLSLKDSHTNMRAWLYTVARNLYFNHLKKKEKNALVGEMEDSIPDEKAKEQLNKLFVEENSKMLHTAMSKLNLRYRQILTLQYFGGLSHKEIGSMLKLTPENVRVLSHRAKQQLKRELEEMNYDL